MKKQARSPHPLKASPLSATGLAGLLQGTDSQGQTHLDMWGRAEDIDDGLGHVLRFETLGAPGERGEVRTEWIRVFPPPGRSSPASTFPHPTLQERRRAGWKGEV